MSKTVKAAEIRELSPGTGKVVQVDDHEIALFNVDGEFFAINNICSHSGGPLCEGDLSADIVECPWHGAQFNVRTGAAICPPAPADVRSFPVRVEGNDVLIELE
ncbi:MAG TPA: non-heme iron oxygenase ferredoxin subunit [Pyrinomonadaceae bacterium]|jgi:3-phenylpropionate/trans-cinnamate dioxygenase ferredoxin subunit|nr:non-heme iron oxygenase ferredoxin subunit [Pyrinomonadaceae bacterium]